MDVADGCLRVGTQEIQLQNSDNKKQPKCRRVYVAETTAIPARSEALITGQLQGGEPVEDVWGSLEPTKKRVLPSEIILARTVVDLRKPTFAVRVMNLSDEERVVRKGTEVACCESVEYVTLISQDEVNKKQDGSQLHRSLQELYDRSAEGLEHSEKRKLHALNTGTYFRRMIKIWVEPPLHLTKLIRVTVSRYDNYHDACPCPKLMKQGKQLKPWRKMGSQNNLVAHGWPPLFLLKRKMGQHDSV